MREALADHLVKPFRDDHPAAINLKDHHIVAAALTREAVAVVSNDRRLREQVTAGLPGLAALSLDEFGAALWKLDPDTTSSVIDPLVSKRTAPAISREQLISRLEAAHAAIGADRPVGVVYLSEDPNSH